MESLTYKKLQQLCKERNLSPCGGKGVTKAFLLSLLTTDSDSSKQRIQQENPSLFAAIAPFVPALPDFRPMATLEQMRRKGEEIPPQNNWLVIERELETLGLEQQQDAATIIISLYEGEVDNLEPYLTKKGLLEEILEIYSGLMWLAIKAAPIYSLLAVLVASGRIDLIPKEVRVEEMIPWIKDREVARYLHEVDPDAIVTTNKLFKEWVEEGEIGKVLWGLEDERVDPATNKNYAIREAARYGHLEIVRELLRDKRVDPSDGRNEAIISPVVNGYVEIVRELLKDKRVNPSAKENYAIRSAAANGHSEMVRELLKDGKEREEEGRPGGADPSALDNDAIRLAATHGNTEVVRELLKDKRVDPSDAENAAIRWAARYGHLEVVRELIKDKRVDPSARENEAIRWAAMKGHLELVRELLKDKRVYQRVMMNTPLKTQLIQVGMEDL